MIEPDHPRLTIRRQCELVGIGRSAFYAPAAAEDDRPASRAQEMAVSAARARHHQTDPRLVRRAEGQRSYITSIPMRRGFLYLVAVMDWASRRVPAWRLSNTMDADFCIAAREEAMARQGRPKIFNTAQGSRFTSPRFTEVPTGAGVRISMDRRGRWMDNVFIERRGGR